MMNLFLAPAHRANLIRAAFAAALAATALAAAPGAARASDRLRVVASINDLASIAAAVGGDRVEVTAIARPTSDVHRVEVLPSYMVRVSRAQVYLKVGLGLDQWADQIVDGSRNAKVSVVDCSRTITPLEKPTGRVDGRAGDVHPFGNPHYWLDPRNGALVARDLATAFGQLDPAHATDYGARADAFAADCERRQLAAVARLATLPTREILTYHSSWVYLAAATGLTVAATVEPVPGIPPTGAHLQELVELVKARQPVVLLQEPYFSEEAAQFLARESGLRAVKVSPSCDAVTADSYLAHFDAVVAAIAAP
jgi:zinc/manganese transport system substrate-binding protein